MTPQKAVTHLRKTMTLAEIAKAAKSSISTIVDVNRRADCRWSLGDRLIRLATKSPK